MLVFPEGRLSGAFGHEQWRPVPGFSGYLVSNLGRVYSGHSDRCLTPQPSGRGHLRVALRRAGETHMKLVHRLVLLAFVGPCPPGKECLHRDDVPSNNRLSNLRWGTRKENRQDAVRNERRRGGKQEGQALTRDQVRTIKRHLKTKVAVAKIARAFKVSRTTIKKIADGKIWKDVV